MATIKKQIRDAAFKLLEEYPNGLGWTEMLRKVCAGNLDFNPNTVSGSLYGIYEEYPDLVYKPARGVFRLVKFRETELAEIEIEEAIETKNEEVQQAARIREEEFYEPFAEWLMNETEECTKAIALGGNIFRDKWGTPDVIGKRESKKSDILDAAVEIVSAEIKPDRTQLITAFGQACAYCLFSHKVYLVITDKAPTDEVSRLDGLCQVFGIGLVLFDADRPEDPNFRIRVRPKYQQMDLFYANRYMKLIEKELWG